MTIPEIDSLFQANVQPDEAGAMVLVARGDEVLHQGGYGLANIEWQVPIDAHTVFQIASITKQFTAAAIMLLYEQGKLDPDDNINLYLPDYPTSGHDITIHHLLTHTSGIFSYTNDEDFIEFMRRDMTPRQMADHFSQKPFIFKPGTRYQYNNSAYVLLGMIIEAASGLSYEDFLRQHIFEPLAMSDTRYVTNSGIIPRRATGYTRTPDGHMQHAPYLSMTLPYAAGALGSTVLDLLKWQRALNANSIISAESKKRMTQPTMLTSGEAYPYGYGLGVGTYHERKIVMHSGGIPGFSTFLGHFPQDDTTIIVLCNQDTLYATDLTAQVARIVFAIPTPKHRPFVMTGPNLGKCIGRYQHDNFDEFAIKAEDGRVLYVGGVTYRLLPVSRTEFYSSDHPDIFITFEDEQDGVYQTATVSYAFRTLSAQRIGDV